jgi:hypothetical protein
MINIYSYYINEEELYQNSKIYKINHKNSLINRRSHLINDDLLELEAFVNFTDILKGDDEYE